jgi:hypothetical protein
MAESNGNRIGWKRLLIVTVIGAAAVITADKIGLVNKIEKTI